MLVWVPSEMIKMIYISNKNCPDPNIPIDCQPQIVTWPRDNPIPNSWEYYGDMIGEYEVPN